MDPLAKEFTFITGTPIDQAHAAMILVHGRGADAASILALTDWLDTDGFALLAPEAPSNTWYPERFMVPLERNEPWISRALGQVEAELKRLEEAGIPAERTILLGFSQGACLALEYAARRPRRYGGVVGLSGGLIGPDDLLRSDRGSLAGTPVFLGCSDVDFHIPRYRVEHAAGVLAGLGGEVIVQLYPGMEHTVNEDELYYIQEMMEKLKPPCEGRRPS